MFAAILTEFLGAFIFIAVIFRFAAEAWGAFPIGLALAAVVLFGGAVSGGHFNPAVSLAMYAAHKLTLPALGAYVVAQLAGGVVAWQWVTGMGAAVVA